MHMETMASLLHVMSNLAVYFLQIVSVDEHHSGGKARPRKTAKAVPGKGRKKQKAAKADK